MDNVREQLITKIREKLEKATQAYPSSIAVATPLGPVADAALEVFAGGLRVPIIPEYAPEMAASRHWYGAVRAADLDEGAHYPVLGVHRDGASVVISVEHKGETVTVRLAEADAADFGLCVASAAYAQQSAPATGATVEVES